MREREGAANHISIQGFGVTAQCHPRVADVEHVPRTLPTWIQKF